jgi:hypothetical protein
VDPWLATTLITAVITFLGGLITRIIWLAGLRHVLRDTSARDRPAILHAYATCQPPGLKSRRGHQSSSPGDGDHPQHLLAHLTTENDRAGA